MVKKTHKQYVSELTQKNPEVEVLGEYTKSNIKTLHSCRKCNLQWEVRPNSLLQGHGCPKCAGVLKKTTETYRVELSQKNPKVELLGEYTKCGTKILHRCLKCNLQWEVVPSSLLQGKGCPQCSGHIKPTKNYRA